MTGPSGPAAGGGRAVGGPPFPPVEGLGFYYGGFVSTSSFEYDVRYRYRVEMIDRQGNVWIADIGNHVVEKYTPDGKLLQTIGAKGKAGRDKAHFNMPTDMAIDPKTGDVFVSDGYGNARVVHFTKDGQYVNEWGDLGHGPGQFSIAHAIAADSKGRIYVADIRMTVCSGPEGFRPVAVYARRAQEPLAAKLDGSCDSWAMLGTNLSEKRADGGWDADTDRLLLMDRRDFNKLGLGPDDLLEAAGVPLSLPRGVVAPGRALALGLLVALHSLFGGVAGFALLDRYLDPADAAVALVEHGEIVAHAVGDRDAVRRIRAGAVDQQRDELLAVGARLRSQPIRQSARQSDGGDHAGQRRLPKVHRQPPRFVIAALLDRREVSGADQFPELSNGQPAKGGRIHVSLLSQCNVKM